MSIRVALRLPFLWSLALPVLAQAPQSRPASGPVSAAAQLDAYLDARFKPPAAATRELAARLRAQGLDCDAVEQLLRQGRAAYGEPPVPRGKLVTDLPLPCDHVDHATRYFLYVPKAYDPARAWPLLVIGHGGSSGRDLAFGARAARSGVGPFLQQAEARGFVVLAPLTDRGWGSIGNSILFSALSRVQRALHVDPDRVYLTGHSMGGHLTWRSAIALGDRFGAVSPMSGGYDYVQDQQVWNCTNVPGYATFGREEPYQIADFNRKIGAWLGAHGLPWESHEKDGGHQIFQDEIPKVLEFFQAHPRALYRPEVWARLGGVIPVEWSAAERNQQWDKDHTWVAGRPLPGGVFHWIRLFALPAKTPADQGIQSIHARNCGHNRIEITSQHVRRLAVYLHPSMVDFGKSVVVVVNGKVVHDRKVTPDLATLLELVREFDDRGRVFHARIDLQVTTDAPVPEPKLAR